MPFVIDTTVNTQNLIQYMVTETSIPTLTSARTTSGTADSSFENRSSIAVLLVNRAFNKYELEDVRKLAAELCGRLHPKLETAACSRDIKESMFAICTSLLLRGSTPSLHPVMLEIRKILEMVLTWPSLDGDEVSKAQHGCIDCLALMICAELQLQTRRRSSL
ncbi:hypothetical protein C5167_035222 [Papaver somniferum]|uniref:Uncharacterized protein n=1 Tax=Papaver somniferum TaxID=3469 RepID=A0A4Y7KFQ3_PAPSO|nr:hypothetical protein C5167_035222 [Papaver somniferum]